MKAAESPAFSQGGPIAFEFQVLSRSCAFEDRNAILACLPERQLIPRSALQGAMGNTSERWSIRRGQPRRSDLAGSRDW
jgi:hypothetical protein